MKICLLFVSLFTGWFLLSCNQTKESENTTIYTNLVSDSIFVHFHKSWNLSLAEDHPEIEKILLSWPEWQSFKKELNLKPKKDLLQVKLKTNLLRVLSDSLITSVKVPFNTQSVKVRLRVINTKIQFLEDLISYDPIDLSYALPTLEQIDFGLNGLYNQFEEILIKSKIPIDPQEKILIDKIKEARLATPNSLKKSKKDKE